MFCLKTAFLNIRRYKQKSILVVLITLLVAFFAFIYINNIQSSQRELDTLPQSLPITARIENLNGSQLVGLEIGESMINAINNSGYVKDLYYSAQLEANFSSVPDEEDKGKEILVRAVNDINAISNNKDLNIQLSGSEKIDFLHGNDAKCVADDVWMQKNDLSIGDTIDINMYGLEFVPEADAFRHNALGKCSLLIVGSMSSEGYEDILCPAGWAKEKHTAAGVYFYMDSAVFTVRNPMDLNAFKAAMKKCYLVSIDRLAQAKVYGDALSVQDETFIKTASRLKSDIAVLYAFAPIVFIVIALVGYALSYLLMQARRTEVILMRSLGTSRGKCVAIMFFEYASLGLLGALLGMGCSMILIGFSGSAPLFAILSFFASFVIGIIGAAFQISKRNAMSGFVKMEA